MHEPDSTSKPAEKDPGRDLASFQRLPAVTKELLQLKDQLEKSTGSGAVALTRQVRDRTRKPRP